MSAPVVPGESTVGGQEKATAPAAEEKAVPKNGDRPVDLTDLSIEELMNVEVTSVTRSKGQKLFTSPAAIYVITEEDIRRSGHQHLAELLRLVPGMHVARITANKWAASSRGFNNEFNRFQLVQIDGRTVYSPVFAGVFWPAQDTVLEDLERVEVIRGPGATLWGANAVNGIINYTTKSAKETQGLLVSGLAGSEERAIGTLRYGGKIGEQLYYRAYLKHNEHDHFEDFGASYTDDWQRTQGGFRFDWEDSGEDHVTWQGDGYYTKAGSTYKRPDLATGTNPDVSDDEILKGYNFLARWTHKLGKENEVELQAYLDNATTSYPHDGIHLRQEIQTLDLDFQHSLAVGERQKIVWGLNARHVDAEIDNGGGISFYPSGSSRVTVSGFFQDTLSILKDRLSLTVGSKVEYNEFTTCEYQPSARVVFSPSERHCLWWAVSRAVRVPTIYEDQIRFTTAVAPGVPALLLGNHNLSSEDVMAYEMGYRMRPVDWFSFDLAGFHNEYDNIVNTTFVNPLPPTAVFKNFMTAKTFGLEATANWEITKKLRFSANYSFLDTSVWGDTAFFNKEEETRSLANMIHLRCYYDITEHVELNAAVYFNDQVQAVRVDPYWRGDLGVTWRPPVKNLEVSLWGTNLFDQSHLEYRPRPRGISAGMARVERGVFGKVTWRF